MSKCARPTHLGKCGPVIICLLFIIIIQLNIFWYKSSSSELDQSRMSPGIEHEKDWRPSQQAIDNWQNTAPFLHCPRGSNRKSESMQKLNNLVASNTSSFCSCPPDVTFILVTNMAADKSPVSEQLYQLCGCRYVHIRLDNQTAWPGWQWSYKVTPVIQWLEASWASLPENSYLVFSDAFDSGLIGNASDLVQRFLEYDCELLGMSTVADWPPDRQFRLFEKEKYPWSKCRNHLSAGAWMASVSNALFYLKIWEDDWKSRGSDSKWNDQMAFRRLHRRFYPQFKVDTLARVWTRCDSGMDCI